MLVALFFTCGMFLNELFSDPPSDPPPLPGGGHGGGGNQPPAGAPIGGGFGILFVIGTAWAGLKIYRGKAGGKEPR
jgi:hypothetical protein